MSKPVTASDDEAVGSDHETFTPWRASRRTVAVAWAIVGTGKGSSADAVATGLDPAAFFATISKV